MMSVAVLAAGSAVTIVVGYLIGSIPVANLVAARNINDLQARTLGGEPLTLADLPSPSTKRWVVRRKTEVVAAVYGGLLTIDEVLERYGLTLEEFASWQRAVDRSGMQGLRVTRIQHYRDLYERQRRAPTGEEVVDDDDLRAARHVDGK